MAKIIRLADGLPEIVDDQWTVIRQEASDGVPIEWQIVPFAQFVSALRTQSTAGIRGVWISPEDEFEPFIPQLFLLDLLAVDFPTFRDGRGYSIATLLRTRYGWGGELRAIGDVLRDQLNYMRRCGFNAFNVRPDKDINDAIKSFDYYSVRYQGAVDNPLPLFRRRHK